MNSSREAYLQRWATLHGGPPAAGLVRWWLSVVHALARPLVATGVSPDHVTALGLAVAAGAPLAVVGLGSAGAMVAGGLVLLGGLLDSLDGAVAVLSNRESERGAVLDSLADRISEGLAGMALWLAGAPAGWCLAAVATSWLMEYLRARAAVHGVGAGVVVPVAERPTRILVAGLFLVASGLGWWVEGASWATVGAIAWSGAAVVGLGLLLRAVLRTTR